MVAVPLQDSMVEIADPHHHHTGMKCNNSMYCRVAFVSLSRRDKRPRSPVKRRYPSTPVVIPNRSKQPDGSTTGLLLICVTAVVVANIFVLLGDLMQADNTTPNSEYSNVDH